MKIVVQLSIAAATSEISNEISNENNFRMKLSPNKKIRKEISTHQN